MNEIEKQIFDILMDAPNYHVAAIKIAAVIAQTSAALQGETLKLALLQKHYNRFYAYEGRVAGVCLAIELIDRGGRRQDIRDAMAVQAGSYHSEMQRSQNKIRASK